MALKKLSCLLFVLTVSLPAFARQQHGDFTCDKSCEAGRMENTEINLQRVRTALDSTAGAALICPDELWITLNAALVKLDRSVRITAVGNKGCLGLERK